MTDSGLTDRGASTHDERRRFLRALAVAPLALPPALLDFWQADEGGNYDHSGYRLRGQQLTNASGEFLS